MKDSIFVTIGKSIGAIITAVVLSLVFEFLLMMAFRWVMDFGLFWFLILGISLLTIIVIIPIGITAFVIQMFKNRVAGLILGLIVSIWAIITTIDFWNFLSQTDLSGSEWFMAITISSEMVFYILGTLAATFTSFSKE